MLGRTEMCMLCVVNLLKNMLESGAVEMLVHRSS